MGVLSGILDGMSSLIDKLVNSLPRFDVDTSGLSSGIATINGYISVANTIFPMDTVCTIIGILIAFAIAMQAFYWIQRIINLIRGCG